MTPQRLGSPRLLYPLAFAYNVALGMSLILVPLYGLDLGYDLKALGLIVASQAVFGLALRFLGGSIVDHIGERRVLLFSFSVMTTGGLVFASSGILATLLAGQLCMGLSRSVFWTAAQSYATRIDEAKAGPILGRFLSASNGGAVFGAFLGGALAGVVGYPASFIVMTGSALAGLVVVATLPALPSKPGARTLRGSLAPLPGIIRRRSIVLAGVASFGAATSIALADILYTPYFEHLGYSPTLTGAMRSVFAIGNVAMGIGFGAAVAIIGVRGVYGLGFATFGLLVVIVPLTGSSAWAAGAIVFATGLSSALLQAVYALIAAQNSKPEERGTALAVAGTWWSAAFLITPAAVGALATGVGIESTFWFVAAAFVAMGLLTPALYRWLQPAAARVARSTSST